MVVLLWPFPAPADDEDGGVDVGRLQTYVAQFDRPRNTYTSGSLTVAATIVPDVDAYFVGKSYLEFRRKGMAHGASVQKVAKVLKKKKQKLTDRAGLRVVLSGPGIHTFHAALPQKTIRLTGRKKGSSSKGNKGFKPVPIKLAADPNHMRVARVRVKKFFKLKEGGTREPILSKPKTVRVLEAHKGEIHLSFPNKVLRKNKAFRLELRGSVIKHYNGNFAQDMIDLNRRQYKWEPIESIQMVLDLPPEGTEVPRALQDLVDLVVLQL
jgi:hypothetical protein